MTTRYFGVCTLHLHSPTPTSSHTAPTSSYTSHTYILTHYTYILTHLHPPTLHLHPPTSHTPTSSHTAPTSSHTSHCTYILPQNTHLHTTPMSSHTTLHLLTPHYILPHHITSPTPHLPPSIPWACLALRSLISSSASRTSISRRDSFVLFSSACV